MGYRPRPARGQAMILFAVSATVLVALAGVAVDSLRVALAQTQMQRAAEAGALAGAVYLPLYPTAATPAPNGLDAATRATQVAEMNGATAGQIAVTDVGSPPLTLRVTIQTSVGLTLAAVLGVGPAAADAVGTATVLAPAYFGPGSASFGGGTFWGSVTGPSAPKAIGDAYSTLCDLSGACGLGTAGNQDRIPPGFGGLGTAAPLDPLPTGASYLVALPPGATGYALWARFGTSGDKMTEVAFSLYRVAEPYNRNQDVPIAAIWPYTTPTLPDTSPMPPLSAAQVITPAQFPANPTTWQQLPAPLAAPNATAPGLFRLTVEGVAGGDTHTYALQLCADGTPPPNCAPGGGTIAGWNFLTAALNVPGTYPLVSLPASDAGQTVTLRMFDSWLSQEQTTITLVPPAGMANPPPAGSLTIALNDNDDTPCEAEWTCLPLTLPADYQGGLWSVTLASPEAPFAGAVMTFAISPTPAIALTGP